MRWIKILAILFILPVFSFLFFEHAARLENGTIVEAIAKSLDQSEQPAEEKAQARQFLSSLRLDQLCFDESQESRDIISQMQMESTCAGFVHYQWAQIFSALLIVLALLHLLITFTLSRTARKSKDALVASVRAGWTLATFFSLIILIGQTVLAAYTLFAFTVVLTNQYFPKLILILVVGGGYALYQVVRFLLAKTPLESNEPRSEEVLEKDAPVLWKAIRSLAQRMQTAPPDTILMGLSEGFYVTEFPVRHASGISRGRTLHLSAPMMQHLPVDEMEAIIGHELGHFKGEDTVTTQKLSPLLFRAEQTMIHLTQGGLVALPSFYAMSVFHFLFQTVISAYWRERELAADAAGASISSPESMARSLVRYFYQAEAYNAAFYEHLSTKAALEASLAKFQDTVRRDDRFWSSLNSRAMPHPFDSHPPLAVRLHSFGTTVEKTRPQVDQPVSLSSYAVWLEGKTEVLKNALKEQSTLVNAAQERLALQNIAAKDLSLETIQKHFPQVVWRARNWRVYLYIPLVLLLSVGAPLIIILAPKPTLDIKIGSFFPMLAGLGWCWWFFREWHNKVFTLNHLGLQLSTWDEMLKFEDIAQMQPFTHGSSHSVTITFHQKRRPPSRHAIFKWPRKTTSINVSAFPEKDEVIIRKMIRYYTREPEEKDGVLS